MRDHPRGGRAGRGRSIIRRFNKPKSQKNAGTTSLSRSTSQLAFTENSQRLMLDALRNLRNVEAGHNLTEEFLKKYEKKEATLQFIRNKRPEEETRAAATVTTDEYELYLDALLADLSGVCAPRLKTLAKKLVYSLGLPEELVIASILGDESNSSSSDEGYDEEDYIVYILENLVEATRPKDVGSEDSFVEEQASDAIVSARNDELLALESIFGSDWKRNSEWSYTLQLNDEETGQLLGNLAIFVPEDSFYPNEPPLVQLRFDRQSPLHSQTKQTLHTLMYEFLWGLSRTQSPAIFELMHWIREEIKRLIAAQVATELEKQAITATSAISHTANSDLQTEVDNQEELRQFGKSLVRQHKQKMKSGNAEVVAPHAEEATIGLASSRSSENLFDESTDSRSDRKRTFITPNGRIDGLLKRDLEKIRSDPGHQQMLSQRQNLPAYQMRTQVLAAVRQHQVVVICGDTGCGKTTQIPQLILDDMIESSHGSRCNIVCTQPRRIAAISITARVAAERAAGTRVGDLIGYSIRLESRCSSRTRLLFCTTGVLLRRMMDDAIISDVSHVIVDEIHERDLDSDFLLIILKEVIARRKDIKVVLMSATLNAAMFSRYFHGCPIIEIPGRTFPVRVYHLEDMLQKFSPNRLKATTRPPPKGEESPFVFSVSEESEYAVQTYADRKRKRNALVRQLKGWQQLQNRIASETTAKSTRNLKETADEGQSDENAEDKSFDPEAFLRQAFPKLDDSVIRSLLLINDDCVNYDLLEILVTYIDAHFDSSKSTRTPGEPNSVELGAILIFLPGMQEIHSLYDRLTSCDSTLTALRRHQFQVFPLHSSISTDEQAVVFKRPPPGVRKVVLATNIAETSITIDDIVYVIDSGRVKENRYDHASKLPELIETWISRASAKQRQGRAGRVREGVCFRMYTSLMHDHAFLEYQIPEIMRCPLDSLCLTVKVLNLGAIEEFLAKAIEPPERQSIMDSVETLEEIGAVEKAQLNRQQKPEQQQRSNIDNNVSLTPLGFHLAKLPIDVRLGKMMIMGSLFKVIDPILTICASLSVKSPFVSPFEEREQAAKSRHAASRRSKSDHLTYVYAYNNWIHSQLNKTEREFCRVNYLSRSQLQMIRSTKRQFAELLREIGFLSRAESATPTHRGGAESMYTTYGKDTAMFYFEIGGAEYNEHSTNASIIRAVICAGLYPNVVKVLPQPAGDGRKDKASMCTRFEPEVFIHPSSVNHLESRFETGFLVYHEMVRTTAVYVRDCTMVGPHSILLFGGKLHVDTFSKTIIVDPTKAAIKKSETAAASAAGEEPQLPKRREWRKGKEFLEFSCSPEEAVLIKEVKDELDRLLRKKIEEPDLDLETAGRVVLRSIVSLLVNESV